MKKIAFVILVAALCIMLCSCAEPVLTKIGGTECNIGKVETVSKVGDIKPDNSGNVLLKIEIEPESALQPDDYTNVFFGETKCKAVSESGSYECKAMAFAQDEDGNLIGVPVFEIPKPGKEPVEYTISGAGFDAFTVSVSARK